MNENKFAAVAPVAWVVVIGVTAAIFVGTLAMKPKRR